MTHDGELLRRYSSLGSEEDFSELVRRHVGMVYACSLRSLGGDRHRAEDITQMVFLALARQARSLHGRENLAGWLFITARFLSAKVRREEQRRRIREEHAVMNKPDEGDRAALTAVLDEVLSDLREVDRAVVLLRFYSGLRLGEVAARLNLSENAVQKRVERSLDAMRTMLVRRGITSGAAALIGAIEAHAATTIPMSLAATTAGAVFAVKGMINPGLFSLFMTTTKAPAIVVGVLSLAGLMYLSSQSISAHALEAEVGAAHRQTETLRQQIAEAENSASVRRQTGAVVMPVVENRSATSAARTPNPQTPAATAAGDDPKAKGKVFLERNPAARELWEMAEKSVTLLRWGPFFAAQKLTPQQVEQFVEWMNRGRFNIMLAGQNGLIRLEHSSPLSPAEVDEGINSILGDIGYERYREYDRLFPAMELSGRFASLVNDTNPLTPDQAIKLARILAESDASYRAGGPVKPENIDWSTVLERSQEILSAEQMTRLAALKAQNDADRAVTRFVLARMPASSQSAPSAPKK